MEKEIWKDIKGYEGFYQVSNMGRVKALARVVYIRGKETHLKEHLIKLSLNNALTFILIS